MMRTVLGYMLVAALAVACKQPTNLELAPDTVQPINPAYRDACQRVAAMPVPVEAAAQLHARDPVFRASALMPAAKVHYYLEAGSQALAMGAYGADLAYTSLYARPAQSGSALVCMRRLGDQLSVSAVAETEQIQRSIMRGQGPDSLLTQLATSYQAIARQLEGRGQLSLSVLMAAGAWTQGMHLLCQAALGTQDDALAQQVFSQHVILTLLQSLVAEIPASESIPQNLSPALARISTELAKAQPVATGPGATGGHMEERDGLPVFVADAATKAEVSRTQLLAVAQATAAARRLIVSANEGMKE